MIIDDADDVSIFSNVCNGRDDAGMGGSVNRTAPWLSTYLPQTRNGAILATSRDKDAAFRLNGEDRKHNTN